MRIQRRNLASFAEAFGLWSCSRSLLAARMFTKWSNFAKPKQTRAKARDYELGNTFRHTRSRGALARAPFVV